MSAIETAKPLASRALASAGLNIYVSSQPKHLRITQTMIEDFVLDPVMGAEVICKVRLDAYQRARLKLCWWTPRVMDSSGFSSAKTFNLWLVSNLRCLLIGDHVAGVYYQVFATGQKTYWKYYADIAAKSAIFRANVGRRRVMGLDGKSEEEGKATLKGPSCWTCDYRNGSQVLMPAGGFLQDAKTQAGIRLNDLYIDEWTKIEAMGSTGIDDQLIGRATRHTFNKHHPFWCNHHLFLATAEDTMHPAHDRYKSYLEEVRRGNPDYALLSYCFKDISDLPFDGDRTFKDVFREDRIIADIKKNKSRAGYRQEALGIWSPNGKGWYTPEMIEKAYATGRERSLEPLLGRTEDPQKDKASKENVHYFLGIDPAKADGKKADDGALVLLRAEPRVEEPGNNIRDWRTDFVWAYKVRQADGPQWASIIHRKHLHFQMTGLLMDPGGGGQWIRPELAKPKQMIRDRETKVRPIACAEDEQDMVNGHFILAMFKRGDHRIGQLYGDMDMRGEDNLIDHAHSDLHEALSQGLIGIPEKFKNRPRELVANWPEEKRWANLLLEMMAKQFIAIAVQTNDDGTTYYSNHNARLFSAKGKKDFAYAGLYAYTRFLTWLKTWESEADYQQAEDDEAGCY